MWVQQTFKNSLPTIYVVGTPIGNLNDFSLRAIETLKAVDYILCEDTRTSQILLQHFQINKPLISLHKYNELERSKRVKEYLNQGCDLAIISDAGIPTISDPGSWLLASLVNEEMLKFNLSGLNCGPAYIHALVASALVAKSNYFHGFLTSKNQVAKVHELTKIVHNYSDTLICFYESVHRIKETILALDQVLINQPQTLVVIARELTKMNEEIIRGTIREVAEFIQSPEFVFKGEFVICFANSSFKLVLSKQEQIALIQEQINQGLKLKAACRVVSVQTGLPINELYAVFLKESGKKT
ncbi:Ribosomal RNA small subunit methyltransferase I [Mesoplasma sp. JKS002658]|uniref:16S rRNA (cytidine(1402)-2'-O)-methyltransferase n=1 Tax=Mesoplasma whartonense TaxID=2878854 RepID=UPI002022AE63|nr:MULTISPECIES: 16S rRNA (cytidine(1402)-2'-O)-methyltransferase [unclassified Mesoplasma]MCL8211311.1 Ribosomal RNA small subunit methyltransferase I [Mesoplasma sp. JKS002664]MCL8212164.1 Ribosomal RNA small subunit methyltransferase I [Mesoplasma sp. JKS002662]MCL8214307.1 Ribosomal RNA small subunit methyltransferase I [Mesoplasma sp. JKS002658]MCL8214649.1 Ribosomal RNA small subunit methyltransferase I [Mesoplasma sp. JKS002663]MCL8215627.1 Ribosomal RNA small subunit methyltransferase 